MDKRTIIFLVLSVGVLIAYPSFLRMMGLDLPTAPPPAMEQVADSTDTQAPDTPRAPAPPPAPAVAQAPAAEKSAAAVPVMDIPAQDIVVETDLYRAVFSTQGGVITSWLLKTYLEDDKESPIHLFDPPEKDARYPLEVSVEGNSLFSRAVYRTNRESVTVSGDATDTLTLTRVDPATGAFVTKILTFHGDSYRVDVQMETGGMGDYDVSLGSNFGIRTFEVVTIGFVGTANLVDGDVTREDTDDLEDETISHRGDIDWTVTEDKYFMAALIPETAPQSVNSVAFGSKHVVTGVTLNGPATFTLYAGPKEYTTLKSFGVNLQENIDFGWFMFGTWSFVRLLAEPMFVLLSAIEGMVGNWGIAIILLTLLIKTAFIPLTHKSYKSMRAMQAIQPQVKAIQKKYKDNKEKLSKETMALYREHQINPLGGCFPILLQIPVFIAFFNILYTAIDLRQTPFMGWIVDLSIKDPYYILPVIMGVSMFVQQKIQPTTMDPKQARIMMFLPVLFTFFFMQFPAGLVLYWLFNNLFTIGQQAITVKFLEKRKAVALAAAKTPEPGEKAGKKKKKKK